MSLHSPTQKWVPLAFLQESALSVHLENIQLLCKKLDNGPKPLPPLKRTHTNTFTHTSYHIQKERKINLKWIIDLLVKNTPNYKTAMKKKVGETLCDLGLEKDF